MFIASYFDRKEKLSERKEQQFEQDVHRSNLDKVLKRALLLHKEKEESTTQEENKKAQIKETLSHFLRKRVKRDRKRGFNGWRYSTCATTATYSDNGDTTNRIMIEVCGKPSLGIERENLLGKNSLRHCAQDVLTLGTFLKHDMLESTRIREIYNIMDAHISQSKDQIEECKTKLEVEADRELKIEQDNLRTIVHIKSELAKNIIEEEEEWGNANIIEYMINEMKQIQKLKKQRDYIISLKSTLLKLEDAKKYTVSRKYDESLNVILDIVKVLHMFKRNVREQIVKGIKFFIPLLKEYYTNRADFLLSSIHWGNNISYVSTELLEGLINNVDSSDDECPPATDRGDDTTGKKDSTVEDLYNMTSAGSIKNHTEITHDSRNTCVDASTCRKDDTPNYYYDERSRLKQKHFGEKIARMVLFDSTYISLIKKESAEFTNILICWNVLEKIECYVRDENNEGVIFSCEKYECPLNYVDTLVSNIVHFFRSFFQNSESPLFKIDKPEWGLKYLLYQSIISNNILKLLINLNNNSCLKNGTLLYHTLDRRKHAEPVDVMVEMAEESRNNWDEFSDAHVKMTSTEKEELIYEMTNYNKVIEKLNYRIITECRLYILSRISYYIHLYHSEEYDKEDIKKAFLNFIHHIILIYKKWSLHDSVNCTHLLTDFFNNTFVPLDYMSLFPRDREDLEGAPTSAELPKEPHPKQGQLREAQLREVQSKEVQSKEVQSKEVQSKEEHSKEEQSKEEQSKEEQSKEERLHQLLLSLTNGAQDVKGVHVRDFFLRIEEEFLVDKLKQMSEDNCCMQLKNSIILENTDCMNEYGHIFIELIKCVVSRIKVFQQSSDFMESYTNHVVKKLLIIVKDEFRNYWNGINDLIGQCSDTCLLYMSFYSISKFIANFYYRQYINEMVPSFEALEKKMLRNFLDAFYHFVTIRIYNLFSSNNIYHEYILNSLYKIKKCLPEHLFANICNKVLLKLDHTILNFLLNQGNNFLHNEDIFTTFMSNSFLLVEQIEVLSEEFSYQNNHIYAMPILREIIKLMTDDIDYLKKKITEARSNYALLKKKNNWINQVTKLTSALLRDESGDDLSSLGDVDMLEAEATQVGDACTKFPISPKRIKELLLRRPDIWSITEKSIVIREFLDL
ncbi:conserved Plasmodium protein, unknown function [Plasmodium ovale wallikeri]|uniref:Uncharacterized protein n=1 Tax=Plasmodium ovale wallikeri TaxID=864142 RepID=A0A1A8Z9R1_PLAOA|nr:conserved Plasmodium protein, unknown function [Plasmodium ovale wallikeri]